MSMTKKQHKALERHTRIVKKRNENHNKAKEKRQMLFAPGASKSYRLYNI